MMLQAYANGIFPMAQSADADDLYWVDPRERGILPLDGFHMSRSLRKTILRGDYEVRTDTAFDAVVAACADRPETWINPDLHRLYRDLHRMGFAHSVEVWEDGTLAGGLYGIALGGLFCGESMFSRRRDGSKIAMAWLVARLNAGGFALLDTQFLTDHLESLGGIEVPRARYQALLAPALDRAADWSALSDEATPQEVVQLSTQTS
ncbi:leucyl/phenylalanyl-tRNA--protein transferase [Oceanomicrobium pacificus]|uniref:Leucyl/phenylalanyl-tRNA--protein transferase n=1 Tax=Oceanomicrobium pacificus TaxID=2692916 RepID=A0A6B0TXB4_9RHOB|nr:leucyl/phenylalanyl-tRNA--protein transferase [Oceanomicrobium pacificus]MXU65794.1 leucyl/phenylalanyl-tRNA--protein transferase [Oceanomicrobium pacificus]